MTRSTALILFVTLSSQGIAGQSKEASCGSVKKAEAQTALEFDWVKMPLADADRLLRFKLEKAGEAKLLRAAVDEMIAAKTAQRVDYTTLATTDGERSYLEAIGEELAGVEWKTQSDQSGKLFLRAAATDLSTPGIQFVTRADVAPDNQSAKVTFVVERMEMKGHLAWNAVKLPVTASMKCSRVFGMKTGEWMLQGAQPSWSISKDGGRVEAPDCVLLMARASVQSPHPAVADWEMPRQCLLLCEAISTDAGTAAALAARFPAQTEGGAMRQAIQEEIDKGTATLEDVSVLTVMTGAAAGNESNCDLPAPKKPETGAKSATGDGASSFSITACGGLQEAEAKWIAAASRWELSLTWSSTIPGGVQGETVPAPGVRTLKSSSKLQVAPNTTVLAATLQNKPDPGKEDSPGDAAKKRVTLLLVKLLE